MNRDNLYSHVSQIHEKRRWAPDPDTKFTCDICTKQFTTKSSIKNHLLQHISELQILNALDQTNVQM